MCVPSQLIIALTCDFLFFFLFLVLFWAANGEVGDWGGGGTLWAHSAWRAMAICRFSVGRMGECVLALSFHRFWRFAWTGWGAEQTVADAGRHWLVFGQSPPIRFG